MTRWLLCCGCLLGGTTLCHAGEPPRVITFSITIATGSDVKLGLTQDPAALEKAVAELDATQGLSHLSRIKFSTLEEQQTQIQFGETTSVATGRSFGFGGSRGANPGEAPRPQAITNYVREQVGTLINTTARVAESAVIAEIAIEQSRFDQARPVTDEPNTSPPAKPTMQLKTSVSIPREAPVLLGGFETMIDGKTQRTVVLVSAVASGTAPAAAVRDNLKVFTFQFVDGQAARDVLETLFPQREFSVAVDERTNSLLVKGSNDTLKTIESVLQLLDQSDVGRKK